MVQEPLRRLTPPNDLSPALSALDVPEAPWVGAGQFSVLLSGRVLVPDLPARPGIIRVGRFVSGGNEGVAVQLSEHDSMKADEPTWDEPELASSLLSGVAEYVSFIEAGAWPFEESDLYSADDRRALITEIEGRAIESGHWKLETVGGENILVLYA